MKKKTKDVLWKIRQTGRRKKIILCAVLLMIACAAAIGYNQIFSREERAEAEPGMGQNQPGKMPGMEGLVTATGTTTEGMVIEDIELDYLETELTIEEIYRNTAEEVTDGTKILKIKDSDLREAKKELDQAAGKAKNAYRQGKIDYEIKMAEAQAEYQTALSAAQSAQDVYDVSAAKEEATLKELINQVDEASELYEEYRAGLDSDAYRTEYLVAEKKESYEVHKSLYEEYLHRWNIDDSEVNTGSMAQGNEDKQWRLKALGLLEDEYREDLEEYETACTDYDKAVAVAAAKIEGALKELELAQLNLDKGQISYDKAIQTLQSDLKSSEIKAETAEAEYQTTIKKLKEDLEKLKDEQDQTAENKEEFESILGDGCLYTSQSGTIVRIFARENTLLTDQPYIMAFSAPEEMTVTASVDQADIASVVIGQSAVLLFEEDGTYQGTVTEINPVSASTGKASVSYSVTLTMEGDFSKISANKTATVLFGISLKDFNDSESQTMERGDRVEKKE